MARFFERRYRVRESDDVLARLNEIMDDIDRRLDPAEQAVEALRAGNRVDVDALLALISGSVSVLAAEMREMIDEGAGGFTPERILETALKRFTSDAEQQAHVDGLAAAHGRIDARATSAALGAHTARDDNPHGVTAEQVGTLTAEEIGEALALRVGVMAQTLDQTQRGQARANIGAIGNLLGPPVIITSSGTYTPGADVRAIIVEAVGGGGGGSGASGDSAARPGGGGGAGGYAMKYVGNPAGSYTVTIGAAGSGGTANAAGGNAGGAGGTTTFVGAGVSMSCTGGSGGFVASTVSDGPYFLSVPSRVFASGGDINKYPPQMMPGMKLSSFARIGGAGGDSAFGAGGTVRFSNNVNTGASDGANAGGFGAGGSGAISHFTGSGGGHMTGGNGSPGVVIIWEFG